MISLRLHQINDVKLIGRLTRDPELKFTSKGIAVCHFDLAVNRRYKDSSGEWKDDASFIPIVAWRETAQRCSDRLKKGYPVYVEGSLKSRSWETKDGEKRSGLEVMVLRIQFLAKMEGEADSSEPGTPISTVSKTPKEPQQESAMIEEEEEIPF